MNIDEINYYKESLYFYKDKLNNIKQTLAIIKSELLNKDGSLNNDTIAGSISLVIDSINDINLKLDDML